MAQAMHFHSLTSLNETTSNAFVEFSDHHPPSSAPQTDLNANNGLTIIWLIERSINEVSHFLQRMHYLAKNAADLECLESERSLLSREYSILLNEIDHYAQTTCFNGIRLTSGEANVISIKLGSHFINSPHMNITLSNLSVWGLNLDNTCCETSEEATQAALNLEIARKKLQEAKTQLALDKLTIETSLQD